MKNMRFANELLMLWPGLYFSEPGKIYSGMMGKEPVVMLQYLGRFATHHIDFVNCGVRSGYRVKILKS